MATDTDTYVDPYAERLAAQRALLAQAAPQMTAEQQAQLAQRQYENDKQYKIGLLAQLGAGGNEGMQNLGGTLVKSALAERQPHVTERGVYDPQTGRFVENPEITQQRNLVELNRIEDRSAEGRRAWQAARQATQEKIDAANTQRSWQEQQAALTRAAMTANRDATRGAAQDTRNATIEDRMADDFNRDTKTQQAVLNAHKNLAAIAQKGDAASDIAFIYSYMKMLDPTSVVREGEFATAQNAAGIPDRVRNVFNSALSGQRLNPQQRAEMLETAGRLGAEAQSQISSTVEQYSAKAQRRALNPENVTGRSAGSVLPNAVAAAQRQQQGGTPTSSPSRGGAVKFSDLPQ